MRVKQFNEVFGIRPDLQQERNAFVQRINQTIFGALQTQPYPDEYDPVFRRVCYQLGLNADDLIGNANRHNFDYRQIVPPLRALSRDDFMETLKILVILHDILRPENVTRLNRSIELAVASAATDLEVRWKDGLFYPSGAKELDEKLISDNLDFIKAWPEVRVQFSTVLAHFRKSLNDPSARKDAITNAYSSIERLAALVLANSKNFENNSNALVDFLDLPSEYKNIVHYYKKIAHEYGSRHAGSEFSHPETEAFIYLTGLLMRLTAEKAPHRAKPQR